MREENRCRLNDEQRYYRVSDRDLVNIAPLQLRKEVFDHLCIRVIRGLILFRRERLNDLFETRIAAERIPVGALLQFTIRDTSRILGRLLE